MRAGYAGRLAGDAAKAAPPPSAAKTDQPSAPSPHERWNVVRGRPGEAKVEYVVDAKRYKAWVSCGTSCPKEGGRMEVEYSAGDPTRVVRNRVGSYSRLAIGALVGIPVGIAVSVVVLRRDLAVLRRRWAHRAFFAR